MSEPSLRCPLNLPVEMPSRQLMVDIGIQGKAGLGDRKGGASLKGVHIDGEERGPR